ncbi:MobP3 family relaxase [Chakrabartyella piscis]|uniref:MobP3 family relaxase n=1 Tax=Chakrabartyella piscis TaxID=2918914 RepID=UPI002958AB78|nr:MobP3 family relaxase [Chakrabartyella piscis]
MPKVILKSNYIKGGGAHGGNLVNYIGTRDGAEKHVQKYVDYIANRKGVEKFSNHGLFTSGNDKIILSKVQEDVANHTGNIWLPIISLTREDAIRTGFDNGTAWKNMLSQIAPKIADYYKIKIDNLQWYASFHNESHHPHVHMVVYSKNPNEGYLTKRGIEQFKAMVTKEVFSLELEQVYAMQSMQRDEVKQRCKDIFQGIKVQPSNEILQLIYDLNHAIQNHKGKKSYGYLKKSDKTKVDKIVDELAKLPEIKEAYDLWYDTKFEIHSSYTIEKPEKLPLSEQAAFRSIKNMILKEVEQMDIDLGMDIELSNQEKPQKLELQNNTIGIGILNVLKSLEKVFTDEMIKDCTTMNQRIDKKTLAKSIEKKEALGMKHTGEDLQNQQEMSM